MVTRPGSWMTHCAVERKLSIHVAIRPSSASEGFGAPAGGMWRDSRFCATFSQTFLPLSTEASSVKVVSTIPPDLETALWQPAQYFLTSGAISVAKPGLCAGGAV